MQLAAAVAAQLLQRVAQHLRAAEAAQGLERVQPAIEAVLFQIGEHHPLHLVQLHVPLQAVPRQEVAVIGRLRVLPLPVDRGEIEEHRLQLPQVFAEGRLFRVLLIQEAVEGQQVAYARQPAPHPGQMAGLERLMYISTQFFQLPLRLPLDDLHPLLRAPVVRAQVQAVYHVEHQHAQAHDPVAV